MKKEVFTAIGLMTGTSIDGVDISLIESDGFSKFTSILNKYEKFDSKLQKDLMILRDKIFIFEDLKKYSSEIQKLEREFTLFHAKVIDVFLKKIKHKIDLIGFHGQTIFHDPKKKVSKQIGDGQLLSQITKKVVVNNFREQDLINGGQGAPLTPIFHKLMCLKIGKKNKIFPPINIINIGGIANITQIIGNDEKHTNIYAYDIGPGNCLIDEWVRKNSNKFIDKDGELAISGKVNELILNQAIENFTIDSYNESLDIKNFDLSFVKGLSLEDGCATITKFSAYLIAKGIENLNKKNKINPEINLVCGGGRKNFFLLKSINEYLDEKNLKLKDIDKFDFDGDFVESQAFGYLSIRSYLKLPISFPSTTRCLSETVGGDINKNY